MGKLQQPTTSLNESDELRELIASCENIFASLSKDNARALIVKLDRADKLADKLRKHGADVRPERGRIDSLQYRVIRNAKRLLKDLGGANAFAEFRAQTSEASQATFWQLDSLVAQERKRFFTALGAVCVVLAALGVFGYIFRDTLFPPNPAGDAINAAQQAMRDQDEARALREIEIGLTQAPSSTELMIWKGVLLARKNDPQAEQWFDQARTTLKLEEFLIDRALVNTQINDYDKIIEDMNAVIARDPESAAAYYVRATGHEGKQDKRAAIADLEKAAELAEKYNNDTLYANAKVRIGVLIQSLP
jgi:tetratricopeptide (TPR) repeat protein